MAAATLWLLDDGTVQEDDIVFFRRQLNSDEMRRYTRYVKEARRRQFLLGRMLLRIAVAHASGLTTEAIRLVERPGNAPQLELPAGCGTAPWFSLSHSRNWITCITSGETALGLDIEFIDPARHLQGLAAMAFDPEECEWLRGLPEKTRVPAFYRLWSNKEAYYKLDSTQGLPPLIDGNGAAKLPPTSVYSYALPHPECSLVICSVQPLTAVRQVELSTLTRADWMALPGLTLPINTPM